MSVCLGANRRLAPKRRGLAHAISSDVRSGHPGNGVRHGMCPTKRELSLVPLPLGEAGRRPGEGAFRCGTFDESTLTHLSSGRTQ